MPPKLITIKANDIENWSNRIESRSELAVLLRQLVLSTGMRLTRVDFPAYDNSERPGWDGEIEALTPTPWIPDGKSGWELSCKKSPSTKANSDYQARTRLVSKEERRNASFVFVTPRNWKKKNSWATEKKKLGEWRDVRAYDASDIEQWIEQSASTQVWFAERLGKSIKGMRSLNQCWSNWAGACDPALSQELFTPAVQEFTQIFRNWIEEEPQKPLVVTADSRDEALAFLYCLTESIQMDTKEPRSSAIVIDSTNALNHFNSLAALAQISVVHTPDVEKNLGDLYRKCHCVIVRPSNDVGNRRIQPDIQIGIVGRQNFESALYGMGITRHHAKRLFRESAGSPTILRRCLTTIPEVQTPPWTESSKVARNLLPMTLVGVWNNANSADREIIRFLAGESKHDEVDKHISELLALEDTPLWSEGDYCGVISRTDSLYGISRFINKTDIENFIFVAEIVLSERDPAIDLPKDDRWAAPIYNQVRDHSDAIRSGILESLILLAEFGENLFDQRLGLNTQIKVETLVRSLLTPLDCDKLLSQNSNLPCYAEAAPEAFLSLIDSSLVHNTSVMREFLSPSETAPFTSPNRTHLLWALECLAWNSLLFPRVVGILVKLCEIFPSHESDNYSNTPASTLFSLFRSWAPKSNASLKERISVFEKLCNDYPMLGWEICMSHLFRGISCSIDNYRPRWRYDTMTEDRNSFNNDDGYHVFIVKIMEIVLNWPEYDEHTLNDLIERIHFFSEDDQLTIWSLVEQWIDLNPPEEAKAYLRHRIRRLDYSANQNRSEHVHKDRIQFVFEKLLPSDQILRCAWLFESYWTRLPPEITNGEKFDYQENTRQLDKLRTEKLMGIWEIGKFEGVTTLLDRAKVKPQLVGESIAKFLIEYQDILSFVEECVVATTEVNASQYKHCLIGFLRNTNFDYITQLVERYECETDSLLTLFLCLPFQISTWNLLDMKDNKFRKKYWRNVKPRHLLFLPTEDEVNRSIDELLTVNRALDAFLSVNFHWDKVESSRLIKLLSSLATLDLDEQIDDSTISYELSLVLDELSDAFDELDKRSGVTIDEKARLEFAFFPLLEEFGRGFPNLEKLITNSPEHFVFAIRCISTRSDGTDDFSNSEFANAEMQKKVTDFNFRLLYKVRRIPGINEQGEIDSSVLNEWLRRVRNILQQYDLVECGDRYIGQILANAPANDDGVWPCYPICEVLEEIASDDIGEGFMIGARNLRGVYHRNEGGNQEREIAERYRKWARELVYDFTFVGRLLEQIADSYDHQAKWEDNESNVRKRLEY